MVLSVGACGFFPCLTFYQKESGLLASVHLVVSSYLTFAIFFD